MLRIDIVTIFPGMFEAIFGESIIKRALKKKVAAVKLHDIRDYTKDKHRKVDDRPFGGGPGMVMGVEPIARAVKALKLKKNTRVILLSPQGRLLDQKLAKELSKEKRLVFICGHYEGIDERVRKFATDEVSIGNYILTGGELPAMVIADSVIRLLPGALGDETSSYDETFSSGLLEYPHYTRPREFMGMNVPDVLLSGDHKAIKIWRRKEALKATKTKRPDLLIKGGCNE